MTLQTLATHPALLDALDKYTRDPGQDKYDAWVACAILLMFLGLAIYLGVINFPREDKWKPASRHTFYAVGGLVLLALPIAHAVFSMSAKFDYLEEYGNVSNEVSSAIRADLRDTYKIQDAEPQYGDHTKREWVELMQDSSLEPAEVLVRTEQGSTVEYEVRLEGEDLRLHQLDTSTPSPDSLLR